jgi:hypothetical protein
MGHAVRMVEMRNGYTFFFGKLEGERPFGTRRHRWENNMNINLK